MNDNKNLERKVQMLLDKSLVDSKPLVITDTAVNVGIDGYAVYAMTDTVFTTLDNGTTGNSLVGPTLPAGHVWFIPILGSVELASGSVIIYQNNILGN